LNLRQLGAGFSSFSHIHIPIPALLWFEPWFTALANYFLSYCLSRR
jgi:hypothetical protein